MTQNEPTRAGPADPAARPVSGHAADVSDIAGGVDALVHRAVRAAPIPPVPRNFAANVARMATDHREHARAETLLTFACAVAILVAAAMFALPGMGAAVAAIMTVHDGIPWPMLAGAALTLVLVGAADAIARVLPHRRTR